jgi:hypothetical protein
MSLMSLRLLWLLVGGGCCLLPMAHGEQPPVHLDNGVIRLRLEPRPGAPNLGLTDLRSGRDLLSAASPLYVLAFASGTVTARDASAITVRQEREGAAQVAVVTFHHHAAQPRLDVECRFALEDTAAEVHARLRVTSTTPLVYESVRFPVCALPLRLGDDPADDRVLLPAQDGVVLEHPEKHLAVNSTYACEYPGTASLQLLAHYDEVAGWYLFACDGTGYRKKLGVTREHKQLLAFCSAMPAQEATRDFSLPYPVVLGAFHGDWQAPAERYRRWALTQPWCRTPLHARTDIPQWLRRAPLFFTLTLAPTRVVPSNPWRQVAARVEGYGHTFGTPVVAILMGWEQHGPWMAPDYFPPFGGAEAMRALNAQLARQGHRGLVFLSGLKWTLQKTRSGGAAYDATAVFQERAGGMAIRDARGAPLLSGTPTGGMGQFAWLCPAAAETAALVGAQVRECQALGLGAVQVDQLVGGWMPPCYAVAHAHSRGGGVWEGEAVYRLLATLRADGKRRDANHALLLEGPCELLIPVIDAYLSRDNVENRWPREAAGLRGVPLFTYIYHAFSLGYGGDATDLTPGASPAHQLAIARNLVEGKLPAAAVWERELPAERVEEGQRALLRAAVDLIHGPAHDYLCEGTRLTSEALPVESLTVAIRNPSTNQSRSYQVPAVLQSRWTLPNGQVGYVLANHSASAVTTTLTVEVPETTPRVPVAIRLWPAGAKRPTVLQARAVVSTPVLVTLPATSALLVEALPLP